MGRISGLVLCLVALGPTLGGCRSSDAPPTIESGCSAMYAAWFDYADRCGAWPSRESMADLTLRCVARSALPGIVVGVDAIQSCAERINAAACGRFPSDCQVYEDTLFPVAPGTRAIGEGCDISAQCASALCSTGVGPCGVCAIPSAVGEPCGPTALCGGYRLQCVDGLCADLGDPVGAPCSAPKGDSDCQRTLYCPRATSVCTPRVKLGDPCGSPGSPSGGDSFVICPEGARCFHTVCTAIGTTTHGGACSEVARCPAGETCRDGSCYQSGVNVGEGGQCIWDYCAAGLRCLNSVCYLPRTEIPEGGSCGAWSSCAAGLFCGRSGCERPRTIGAVCAGDSACAPGLRCYWSGGNFEGTCQVAPALVGEGQPCGYVHCTAGLRCVSLDSGSGYSCQHLGVAGERCGTDLPCRAPFECRYPSREGSFSSGICRAPSACSGS